MQSLFIGAIFGHIIQAKTRRHLSKLGICPKQCERILLWSLPHHLDTYRSEIGRGVDIVYKSALSLCS